MCGVIGIQMEQIEAKDLTLVRKLFQQSMIRGKHATGVTYFNGKELVTIKEPIPADEFIEKHDPENWVYTHDMAPSHCITLIGHIRYSTSDLRYNQPFQGIVIDEDFGPMPTAIAHNGVLSQESASKWEYDTQTLNDSEMILRALESGDHPLEKFANKSQAVTQIQVMRRAETDAPFAMLYGYRNHERPLWRMFNKGLIFASTKDILLRSDTPDDSQSTFQPRNTRDIKRCEPFIQYNWGGVSRRWHPDHLGTELPEDLQP